MKRLQDQQNDRYLLKSSTPFKPNQTLPLKQRPENSPGNYLCLYNLS